jgi:hypothetical protein
MDTEKWIETRRAIAPSVTATDGSSVTVSMMDVVQQVIRPTLTNRHQRQSKNRPTTSTTRVVAMAKLSALLSKDHYRHQRRPTFITASVSREGILREYRLRDTLARLQRDVAAAAFANAKANVELKDSEADADASATNNEDEVNNTRPVVPERVTGWKQVRECLEEGGYFVFPGTNCRGGYEAAATAHSGNDDDDSGGAWTNTAMLTPTRSVADPSMENYEKRLLYDTFASMSLGLTPSQRRMLSVAGYMGGITPVEEGRHECEGHSPQVVDGDDPQATASPLRSEIEEMTRIYLHRHSHPAIRSVENRLDAEQEASERALELMRPLSDEEQAMVDDAIFGPADDENEVVASEGADKVIRSSMRKLAPRRWLNDEIIHYFYVMLSKRDAELCKNDPNRKRSHFFKSFFITKLLQEGHHTQDGQYDYNSVKRWSRFVPGTFCRFK